MSRSYDVINSLAIVKCSNWDYVKQTCSGSWTELTSTLNSALKTINTNTTGFSAYFLAEDRCGNGICEANYNETTSTCSADCASPVTTTATTSTGSGGTGSVGIYQGLSQSDLLKIEELLKGTTSVGGVRIDTSSIYKEMFPGDSTSFRVKFPNALPRFTTIKLDTEGDVKQFISFIAKNVSLGPNEEKQVLINAIVPKFTEPATYDGDVV